MTTADKTAIIKAIDAAKEALEKLETACCDHDMPRDHHAEVYDLQSAVRRMRRRILEMP